MDAVLPIEVRLVALKNSEVAHWMTKRPLFKLLDVCDRSPE